MRKLVRRLASTIWLFGVAALTASCTTITTTGPSDPYGSWCMSEQSCASDICLYEALDYLAYYVCTRTCETLGEPCEPISGNEAVCIDTIYLGRVCAPHCTPALFEDWDYACVNGVPTLCSSVAPAAYCQFCGCPDTSQYCNETGPQPTCVPRLELGEPCESFIQCLSRNCERNGLNEQTCVMDIGESSCDDSICERCMGEGEYCSGRCPNSSCPEGSLCTMRNIEPVESSFWCRPLCAGPDAPCPTGMECLYADNGDYACDTIAP